MTPPKGSTDYTITNLHNLMHTTLWWNLRQAFWCFQGNERYLVNYGRRYRKGLPDQQRYGRVGGQSSREHALCEEAADAL